MSFELFIRPDLLAAAPGIPPIVAKYAQVAFDRGGLTVGAWLGLLEDFEIDHCMERIEEDRHDEEAISPWVLFGVMLANGEGMPVTDDCMVSEFVRTLVLLLQVEMMHREGHVELDLTTLSLATFDIQQVRTLAVRGPDGTPAVDQPHQLELRRLPLRKKS